MAMAAAAAGLRRRAAEAMLWRPQATAAARARRGYASAEKSGRSDGTRSNDSDSDYKMEMKLPMITRFEKWMAKHGITYKNKTEKAYRFKVFKETVKFVDANPEVGGLNIFADRRDNEIPRGRIHYPGKKRVLLHG